jgi:hypothetical protein
MALEREMACPAAHTPIAVMPDFPTRQCAWCWLVMDATGQYRIRPGHKIQSATHGICPNCKELVRAEIDRSAALQPQPLLMAA